MTNNKVVLVFPGPYAAIYPEIPLNLLYLAAILRNNGFETEIFDMRLCDLDQLSLDDTLCVGITVMTGPMITYGLEFARRVRIYDSKIPIVWGGVHPSLLPEQTAKNRNVDVVVRGEGEMTFLDLVRSFDSGEQIDEVKGITFSKAGKIISNPDREFIDLNKIPIELPYDIIELEKYWLEVFPVHTSRGCPHQCSFCYNLAFNKCSYRCKSAKRVLDEIEYLIEKFGAKRISFVWEDNFFTNRKRVEEICKGIIKRNLDIQWDAFCRFDYAASFDDRFLQLLESSGCVYLSFGGESGSQEVLDKIDKGTRIDQIIKVTKKFSKTQIAQITSFMIGIPGETDEQVKATYDLIDYLARINPKAVFNGIFPFTPYPGTDLTRIVIEKMGFQPPETLEEWQNFKIYRDFNSTWVKKSSAEMYRFLSIMTRFPFYTNNFTVPSRFDKIPYKQVYLLLSRLARFRWKHRIFKFNYEWWLVEKMLTRIRGFV